MKITLYKQDSEKNTLTRGEKVTISDTNGCTVTTWIDFVKSGLIMLSRENMAFWGFNRVLNSYLNRGYNIIKKSK